MKHTKKFVGWTNSARPLLHCTQIGGRYIRMPQIADRAELPDDRKVIITITVEDAPKKARKAK